MFTLPDLPYPASALEPYIDTSTMEIHHGKHHAAYVKNLNDALATHPEIKAADVNSLLTDPSRLPDDIRTKVKNNGGGHANHSFFWPLMSPDKDQWPSGDLLAALNSAFGNLDTFKEKFSSAALNHFGSGWAWLVTDKGKLEIIDTLNQDSPLSLGKIPLLTVDVWEHAYYLKYQNRRSDYIAAWWHVVNWSEVASNFSSLGL